VLQDTHMRTPKQPINLLFVLADQWRWCDLGCYVNAEVKTPNLDAFAVDGIRFEQAYATSPVCGPNRACLLTGMYPHKVGVPGNDLPLAEGAQTLGMLAKSNGHATVYVGKWHLDGQPRSKFTPPGKRRFGFDRWAVYNCAHDYLHPRWFEDTPQLIEVPGYEPEVQTTRMLQFLDDVRKEGKPFTAVLSWGPPHDPYQDVPAQYRNRYDPDKQTLRPNAQPDVKNPLARNLNCRRATADYRAACTALDDQFGRIIAYLKANNIYENTIVIFTSDHGDMLWSHGWLKKQNPYDESIRVPLIARIPGEKAGGRTTDALIGTVDLLPSIAGLMGWKLPSKVDGWNLSHCFTGKRGKRRDHVLLANYVAADEAKSQGLGAWRALRTKTHTYVEHAGGKPWMMFDNERDPYQMTNIIDEAAATKGWSRRLRESCSSANDPHLPEAQLLEHLGLTKAWELRNRPGANG
jgi:arylsulfatase A-like enzyme